MKNFYKTFLITLILVVTTITAYADTIYSSCLDWGDFSDTTNYDLYAVNPTCQSKCESQCTSLFSNNTSGNEINTDQIYNCLVNCQNGQSYTGFKRLLPTDTSGSPITNNIFCTVAGVDAPSSADYPGINYVKTATSINCQNSSLNNCLNNLSISMNIVADGSIAELFPSGAVYRCGINFATLVPAPYSSNPNDYSCAAGSGTNCPSGTKTINTQSWNGSWSAINQYATNTGINVVNGDFLDISWQGQYLLNCDPKYSTCSQTPQSFGLMLHNPSTPFDTNGNDSSAFKTCSWCDVMPPNKNASSQSCSGSGTATCNVQGLSSSYATTILSSDQVKFSSGIYPQQYQVSLVGQLTGMGSGQNIFVPLRLAHFYPTIGAPRVGSQNTPNVLGGLFVSVKRLGCMETSGASIQYAFIPSNQVLPTADTIWSNVGFDDNGNAVLSESQISSNIAANMGNASPNNYQGTLFLRTRQLVYDISEQNASYAGDIDAKGMLPNCNGVANASDCTNTYNEMSQMLPFNDGPKFPFFGYYTVRVKNFQSTGNVVDSYFSTAVNKFRSLFFGDGVTSNSGLVQQIFNGLIANPFISSAIQAVIVLFIAWTGISYMIGLTPIGIQDVVARLFKLSIVAALLTPTAWSFFNTYLFELITNGGFQLINLMLNQSYLIVQDQNNAMAAVFQVFDPMVDLFTRSMFWARIAAAMVDSFAGFMTAVFAVIAVYIYATAVIRIVMMYLICIIALAILLMLTPLFILFLLFNYTKELFDNWLGQLINYTLQPVAIFVGVAFMSQIMYYIFKIAFSFPICKACLFSAWFPFFPIIAPVCLIPMYKSVGALAAGSDAMHTSISLASAFALLVMAHGIRQIASIMSTTINRISGFNIGIRLSDAANNATRGAISAIKTSYGLPFIATGDTANRVLSSLQADANSESGKREKSDGWAQTATDNFKNALESMKSKVRDSKSYLKSAVKNANSRLSRLGNSSARADLENGLLKGSIAMKLSAEIREIRLRADTTNIDFASKMAALNANLKEVRDRELQIINDKIAALTATRESEAANAEQITKLTNLKRKLISDLGDQGSEVLWESSLLTTGVNRTKVAFSTKKEARNRLENEYIKRKADEKILRAERLKEQLRLENEEYEAMLADDRLSEGERRVVKRYIRLRRFVRASERARANDSMISRTTDSAADYLELSNLARIKSQLAEMEQGSNLIKLISKRENLADSKMKNFELIKASRADDRLAILEASQSEMHKLNEQINAELAGFASERDEGRAGNPNSRSLNLTAIDARIAETELLQNEVRHADVSMESSIASTSFDHNDEDDRRYSSSSEYLAYGPSALIKDLESLKDRLDANVEGSPVTGSWNERILQESKLFDASFAEELKNYKRSLSDDKDFAYERVAEEDKIVINTLAGLSADQLYGALSGQTDTTAFDAEVRKHCPDTSSIVEVDQRREIDKYEYSQRADELKSALKSKEEFEREEGAYKLEKREHATKRERFEHYYQMDKDFRTEYDAIKKMLSNEEYREERIEHALVDKDGKASGGTFSANQYNKTEEKIAKSAEAVADRSHNFASKALGNGLLTFNEYREFIDSNDTRAMMDTVLKRSENVTAYCYDTLREFTPVRDYVPTIIGTTTGVYGSGYKYPDDYKPGSEKIDGMLNIPTSLMTKSELAETKRVVDVKLATLKSSGGSTGSAGGAGTRTTP